ncbi:MAG: FAD-dependent oxidoreductase [Streptomycetaceae bacterium]|nr:FAD-dependent oxidoreductase [Streptomycetaceae bacterium]
MPFHAPHSDPDVIVVGAGLAGLSAAHHLINAGVTVAVLEAEPRVGGRISTESVDGFRLDRGSQLLNSAYPELRRIPGLRELKLLPLTSLTAPATGTRGAFGAFHKARLSSALGKLAATPLPRLLTRAETTTAQALAARGFPPRMVDGFLRPLLTSLLHDPQLTTSSRCADLVLRGFARGRLALPAGGSGVVPGLLTAALPPDTVRLGTRAVSVCANTVTTADGDRLCCRAVVVATGAHEAAKLLPGLRVPSFHPVTVVHHAADAGEAPRLREPALVLNSEGRGPVAHTLVASAIDRSRAPAGRALITSTVLGRATATPPELLDRSVRAHLAQLHGTPTDGWQLLAVHHDPRAVPAMPAPHDLRRPVRVLCGLYVCGDHRDTSTVQGALFSGRRAAHHVMRDFGIRPGYGDTARDLPTAA